MYRKIFISFLLLTLINFLLGCYSSELVTVPEYNQIEEIDKPDDIRLITKDFQEYYFSESNFYVENDTLYGKVGDREQLLDRKIALSDIASIEAENVNWLTTSLLVLGIAASLLGVFFAVVILAGGFGPR